MANPKPLESRYGMLTPIEPTDKRANGQVVWRCRCDCGKEFLKGAYDLKQMRSCGCAKKGPQPRMYRSLEPRYGRLVPIRPTDRRYAGGVVWKCRCDCGNIAYVPSRSMVIGGTKSCGCLKSRKKL